MRQHFMMFATYNRWANERLYAASRDLSDEELDRDTGVFFHRVMGTLNHILATDRIWLKRFTGKGEAPFRARRYPPHRSCDAAGGTSG